MNKTEQARSTTHSPTTIIKKLKSMKTKLFVIFVLLIYAGKIFSQDTTGYLTPNGYQDTVFDGNGRKVLLKRLLINPPPPFANQTVAISTSCTAGYFNIYYATNSGLDQLTNPVHMAKRDIVCKVFTDLSNLINSPLSVSSNTTRVNILIDDPTYALSINPTFYGGGTPFYCLAANPASANPGLLDCEIYKTIASGVDSYSNAASPVVNLSGGGNFYHGSLVFNPNVNWNLNSSATTMTNQAMVDLYSVALHEATHLLGFGSLINYGGGSIFGPSNNYYSRYDKFLTTSAGVPLLATSTTACYNYNVSYNVAASVIAPGSCQNSGSSITNCNSAVRYIGTPNVAVFTPNCYKSGSSLSHFEDMCSTPGSFATTCTTTPSGSNNDLYFVMSDAGYAGDCGIKRHYQPAEEQVLCDLGYNLNAIYNPSSGATYAASVTAGAQFNYTNTCSSSLPVGVNDGLAMGNYLFSSNTSTILIPLATVIGNDFNTTTITCIEPVYNNGVVSIVGGNIRFVANTNVSGIILLRYLPKNASGALGNITYIYAFITPIGCSPANACNLVQNGGFENLSSFFCGIINIGTTALSCWSNVGSNQASPDLFTQFYCPNPNPPYGTFGYQLGVNTYYLSPPVNAHNAPNPSNTKMAGVTASLSGTYTEPLKNYLSSPLIPGQVYVLNCWLYSACTPSSSLNPGARPVVFSFAGDAGFGSTFPGGSFPGTLSTVADFTVAPVKTWIPCIKQFTFTGSQNNNVLYLGINTPKTVANGYPYLIQNQPYLFVDDISILPASQSPTSTLPGSVPCTASSILNLGTYIQPTGGVFSGPGVTTNGTQFDFNAAQTMTPGIYGITYSYTTSLGCPQSISYPVTISSFTGTPVFSMPSVMCQNAVAIPNMSVTISPTILATNCSWAGNGIQTTYNLYWFSNITNYMPLGLNTYTYNHLGCNITLTTTVNNAGPIPVTVANTASQTCLSPGQSATLTASSPSAGISYTWQPGVIAGSSVVVTPSTTIIYTLTAQSSTLVCANAQTVAVRIVPPITFTNVPTNICGSRIITWLEDYLAPGTPTGGVFVAPGTYTTLVNTNSVVTGMWLFAPGTPSVYTVNYIYTPAPGSCTVSNSFTFNALPIPVITTNGTVTFCSNLGGSAPIAAVSNNTLTTTYTWMPGALSGPTQNVNPVTSTIYTVTAYNSACGYSSGTVAVNVSSVCCQASNTFTSNIIPSGTYSGQWSINQNAVINGTVILNGEFMIAPNVSITIPTGSVLKSGKSYAHLYCCNGMWYGIIVNSGGLVQLKSNDLVEDAYYAITSIGSTNSSSLDIDLYEVTFNRNYVGVYILNYLTAAPVPPFGIVNCIFTGRNFNIPPGGAWPLFSALSASAALSNPLASPYTIGNYPQANLKSPNTGIAAYAGVIVQNSGVTLNPATASPSYYNINVGATFNPGSPNTGWNIFDNIRIGIMGSNSNLGVYCNVFQNLISVTTTGGGQVSANGGYGVVLGNVATSGNTCSNLDLVSPFNPTLNINRFYDCRYAVITGNVFRLNAQYMIISSTKSALNTPAPGSTGQFGIYMTGNKYKQYTIKNNAILNIGTGVYLSAARSGLYLPGFIWPYGEYWGQLDISNNLFCPSTGTAAAIGNGYVDNAILLENSLGNTQTYIYSQGTPQVSINNNTVDRVRHGLTINGFNALSIPVLTASNNINLVQDPSGLKQWGMSCTNSRGISIISNTITGFNLGYANSSGVYNVMTNAGVISCNTVAKVYNGFEFAGLNNSPKWSSNTMHYNTHGMMLGSNGIIGVQGSFAVPSDNLWDGTWYSGSNYGTWTDASSIASNSKLYVRNATGYIPPNNAGVSMPNSYFLSSNLPPANNGAPYASCLPPYTPYRMRSDSGNVDLTLLNNIAADNITYTVNVAKTAEINKGILFSELQFDTLLKSGSDTLVTFYNNNLSTNLGALSTMQSDLAAGDFSSTQDQLDAFGHATDIQSTAHLFYQLQLNYLQDDTLNAGDNSSLGDIAHLCPFTSGPVVYEARALFNLVNRCALLYDDTGCDNDGTGHRTRNAQVSDKQVQDGYTLYPNPAAHEIYIMASQQKTKLSVSITDVNGQELLNKTVQLTDYSVGLKVDLLNGIYFVNLVDEAGTHTVKKLVIAK